MRLFREADFRLETTMDVLAKETSFEHSELDPAVSDDIGDSAKGDQCESVLKTQASVIVDIVEVGTDPICSRFRIVNFCS